MVITFREAVEIIRKGGIVAYPTETVYGLAVRIDNREAVRRLKKLKEREGKKPILIALPSVDSIKKYAFVSEKELSFLRKILPGPVSVLLPKKKTVPSWITTKKFVGIRVPANRTALRLAKTFGAITSTSANKSGEKPATTPKEVEGLGLFSVLPGKCRYSGPSTLLDIKTGKIIREGVYPSEKLKKLWSVYFKNGKAEKRRN